MTVWTELYCLGKYCQGFYCNKQRGGWGGAFSIRKDFRYQPTQPLIARLAVILGLPEHVDRDLRQLHRMAHIGQPEGHGNAMREALGHGGDEIGGLEDVAE